jgi:hypothetical protein
MSPLPIEHTSDGHAFRLFIRCGGRAEETLVVAQKVMLIEDGWMAVFANDHQSFRYEFTCEPHLVRAAVAECIRRDGE